MLCFSVKVAVGTPNGGHWEHMDTVEYSAISSWCKKLISISLYTISIVNILYSCQIVAHFELKLKCSVVGKKKQLNLKS